jgi:VanZ family protein
MSIVTIQRVMRIVFWSALLIAYVCAVLPNGPEIGSSDKDGHVLAFVTLAGLARLGWSKRGALRIAVALLLFGIFIELSQATPIVHRDADVWDVVADSCGILLGLGLGSLALFAFRRRIHRAQSAVS